jgi:transcriptional regulator with XRE-family HTH domain
MMHAMKDRDRTLVAFGRNVARLRNERGYSQDQLAEKADLDRTFVSGIERGLRNPGIKTVLQIARALNVGVGELCEGMEG